MERVLVVCGAGASSTFLAHRMRRLATESGPELSVEAGSESELATLAAGIDVVLVGPHLERRFGEIEAVVAREGGMALLLPSSAFTAQGAVDALQAVRNALGSPGRVGPAPVFESRPPSPVQPLSQAQPPSPVRPPSPAQPPIQGAPMTERTVRIASEHGLHARPASLFTQAAARLAVPVQIAKAGKSVNAASILGVISLGIEHGDEVVLSSDGDSADAVLAELATMLESDLDKE